MVSPTEWAFANDSSKITNYLLISVNALIKHINNMTTNYRGLPETLLPIYGHDVMVNRTDRSAKECQHDCALHNKKYVVCDNTAFQLT